MVGLFNYNPGIVADPQQQGFGAVDPMGAMMGLMAMGNAFNRKPRYTTSISEATAPDDSGMQTAMGLMNYQRQAQRDKLAQEQLRRQQQLDALKVDEYQRGVTKEKEWADAAASGDQNRMMEVYKRHDPKGWWASQQKDQTPITVAPGATMVDRSGRPIFTAPAKPENEPEMLRMMKAAGIDPATPQGQKLLQDRLARWGQGTTVNVDMKQDGAAAKKIGEMEGDMYGNMQKAAMNAQVKIGKLNRLESALKEAPQGALGPQTQRLREVAESLGVKGLTGDAAPGQIARSISQEIALQLRDPSSGAGMPGAMSDADRQFLQQMVPGLANTPEGNAQLVDYMKRLHKRELDVARLAREHKNSTEGGKAKGAFDDGFFDKLAAWSEKNPLFPEAATMPKPAGAPQPQAAPQQAPQMPQVGQTASNPQTGEKIRWDGQRWVPVPTTSVKVPIR